MGNNWIVIRIHPEQAKERGIQNRDIIKVFNDRGTVLGIAQITERVRPGVIHCYTSSGKYDPLEKGKAYSPDRGGCINLLTRFGCFRKTPRAWPAIHAWLRLRNGTEANDEKLRDDH